MEKETLIQNLRTRVGEDNCKVISDKTFDAIASVYLPQFADDAAITDDTWKLPVTTLNEFAGQKRYDEKEFTEKYKSEYATQHEKDVEERIKTATAKAIEDYKKEHPEQKTDPSEIDKKISDAVSAAIAGLTGEEGTLTKLSNTVTSFINSQNEREKNTVKAKVRGELKEHILALKANNEACIDDALDGLDYGDNPTFADLKQKAIDAYEKRYKRYYGDGAKPFGGAGSGSGASESSYVKDRIKELEEEAKRNAGYAEEMKKTLM